MAAGAHGLKRASKRWGLRVTHGRLDTSARSARTPWRLISTTLSACVVAHERTAPAAPGWCRARSRPLTYRAQGLCSVRRVSEAGARPRSGLLPSLIGVCHVAIQFPLYEYAKERLAQRSGCSPDELPPGQLVRPLRLDGFA